MLIEFRNQKTWEVEIPSGEIDVIQWPSISNDIHYVYSCGRKHPTPIKGKSNWTEFRASYIDLNNNYGAYFLLKNTQTNFRLSAIIYDNKQTLLLDGAILSYCEFDFNNNESLNFGLAFNDAIFGNYI